MASHDPKPKNAEGSAYPQQSLFGRRKGRPLGEDRQAALDNRLPEIDLSPAINQEKQIDLSAVFGGTPSPLWMEIGFGNGEHLATLMRRHPGTYFIGAEPFINGMSAFLMHIKDLPNDKIRVLMDDAIKLCRLLPDKCLDGLYILNPDPWPKTRHHRRRIVSPENLDIFARLLKPGASLIMTTDVPGLADWMVTHANNHTAFTWQAECAADWQTPPEDWIPTRYETKRANGADKMAYLFFERKP
ncbi:MAG: tRNA (guanosine(46)-N7)-methyltransferase TrmB [Alphaproteobacteria bacterium]|nr:tRNA (guanosine(46)-N7)-methyltransferase TrmB [Alphaproteobacteria bacterium]